MLHLVASHFCSPNGNNEVLLTKVKCVQDVHTPLQQIM
uniref:Uncharacterized protein n=1 Tax=Nelumbo nucifera TaxID=4432 RepID=A0A822YA89_NELNU|nr:TPA_asm: hypothetical protein HUJ06_029930 [Nelumbo nucifera]